MKRVAASLTAALVLGVAGVVPAALPAAAAAPANDTQAGATELVGFTTVVQDTTEATTSADETALNEYCGAPEFEQAVWFLASPAQDGFVAVDVASSSYSAGILVLEDTPGGLLPVSCGPGRVAGPVAAGGTYYVVVFGDGLTLQTSGELVLSVEPGVEPPQVDLTVDRRGSVDRSGVATISGTVTCTSADGSGLVFELFGELRQAVGRFTVSGAFGQFVGTSCDGETYPWSAQVAAPNGKFAGGKAATLAIAFACTDGCSEGYVEATIQLTKGRR